jgi:hypothetical protein
MKTIRYVALALFTLVACSRSSTPSPTQAAVDAAVAASTAVVLPRAKPPEGVTAQPALLPLPPKPDKRTPAQKLADAKRDALAACRGTDGVWHCSDPSNKNGQIAAPLMASGNATAAQCGPACTVGTWQIDPANSSGCASDSNSCTLATCAGSGIGPCLSRAQVIQRVGSPTPIYPYAQSVVLNYVSALPAGKADPWFAPQLSGGGTLHFTGSSFYTTDWLTLVNCANVASLGVDNTGSTDVGATMTSILPHLAAIGQAACLPAGTYKVATPITVPSGASIFGAGYQTTLESTQSFSGFQTNDIFSAFPTSTGNTGTIHAAPAIGATSVTVDTATAPQSGQWLQLGYPGASIITAQIFKLAATCTGASAPFTCALDRPVVYPFTSGATSTVRVWSAIPQDIHLSSMHMTGTGDRAIEFLGCFRCSGTDLVYDTTSGTMGDSVASFDVGSRNCLWNHNWADMTGATGGTSSYYGWMLEGNEGSAVTNSHARGCANGSNFLVDGWSNGSNDNTDEGGAEFGFYWGQGSGLGAIACSAKGDGATSPTGFNMAITTNVTIDACSAMGSTLAGLNVASTSTGTVANNFTFQGNGSATNAVAVASDLSLSMIETGITNAVNVVNVTGSGNVTIHDSVIALPVSGNGVNAEPGYTGRIGIYSTTIGLAASALAILPQGGTMFLRDVKLTGSGASSVALYTGSGVTTWIETGTDLTAAATLIDNSGIVNMVQGGGLYADTTTSGTVSLTQVQAQNTSMKFSQTLSGNITYNVPANLPGLMYNVDLSGVTLSGHTFSVGVTGGSAVSLTAAQHIVYSDGTNAHTVLFLIPIDNEPANDNVQRVGEMVGGLASGWR